ncbi:MULTISPECIES: universal stress protein [Streptomyces]|uniref:universal stress protein n=1 Tax=Streptomyces TaxID=1883 RepID=UPI003254C047
MERVIVTGVDGSARGRAAADWAAREAALRGLPLRVIHVPSAAAPHERHRPESAADRFAAELARRHPGLTIDHLPAAGTVAQSLMAWGTVAEMIVLGLRGEGGRAGLFPGPTARAVAGAASCPVVLVPSDLARGRTPRRPDKVTLAVDARDPADGALGFAFDEARLRGARLHALHAGPPPVAAKGRTSCSPSAPLYAARSAREMEILAEVLDPWRAKFPHVRVTEDVVLRDPARALVRTSVSSVLLVLGRRTGAPGLGAVALAVARHTGCPLALVPG